MRVILALALLASPALAQEGEETCPPPPNHTDTQAAILRELREAPDPATAQPLADQLWLTWLDAPDERAQALLDEGMARRQGFDLLGSVRVLDLLVAYCPDYAEGYNQRAFSYYLAADYPAALRDLEIALEINPAHIGALSGKALSLIGMGQHDGAQTALREALDLNPWLSERALLEEPDGETL